MLNRSTLMKDAWAHYRRVAGPRRSFDRRLFADVLRFIWSQFHARVAATAERLARPAPAPVAKAETDAECAMNARLDALQLLPFRYRIEPMAAAIRAEYAHA